MLLVLPNVVNAAEMVGRTPWSAADAPVGLPAPWKMRDEGVLAQRAPRPGGPPHQLLRPELGKMEWHSIEVHS
jgi:hypothetical protein